MSTAKSGTKAQDFASLGLAAPLVATLDRARLRRADASAVRSHSADARGPGSARPGGDRHRQDGGVRAADDPAAGRGRGRPPAHARARARADARAGDAAVGSHPQVRARHRHPGRAALRWRVDGAADSFARAAGADIAVATPGRALDHLRRKTLTLDAIRVLVLDEADEMLDMGFAEDIDAILEATAKTRQTALFSATLPARILSIAKRHLPESRPRHDRRREDRGRQAAARPPGRLRRPARPEAGGARSHPRHGESRVGDRLLPDAPRGGLAHRDAERARLPGRGAARRHAAAPARRGHEPSALGEDRPADCHRRRRARPGYQRTCRTWSTTTCPRKPSPTSTGSAAPGVPGARAPRSRWSSRASTGCCARSSSSPGRRSRSPRCRRWRT